MPTVTLARHAMATRFELVLLGDDPVSLRAAGEEALDEIERLEAQLSLYRPTSEIAHLNAQAAVRPVRVEPGLFRLLQRAKRLSDETDGAFDITVGPLVRCWGFMGGTGQLPDADALAHARAVVGMDLVELDEADFTVRFAKPGMMLDLGALGKGYALERAAALLREAGVRNALLHGGTSTVCALGKPAEVDVWKVAVELPPQEGSLDQRPLPVAVVPLVNESLSVSAVWGKAFVADGRTYGHVIDPRLGEPVQRAVLAAVALPSATETDALSTALLTSGPEGLERITALRDGMRALVIAREELGGQLQAVAKGLTVSLVAGECGSRG
ncbi:MAG: FAD:protein FMN transferase [Pedosphaera parvula]|nr:FAD:protein FMN transferase [Verrucomicrobiota bacterium]MBI3191174.1 FAD:protein FMN transferase [Pedosphaera parvula]